MEWRAPHAAGEVLGSVRGDLRSPELFTTVMVGKRATGCSSYTEHLGVEVSSVGLSETGVATWCFPACCFLCRPRVCLSHTRHDHLS